MAAPTPLTTQLVCFKGPYTLVDSVVTPAVLAKSNPDVANGNIFDNVRGKTLLFVQNNDAGTNELTITIVATADVAESPGELDTVSPTVVVDHGGAVKIIGPFTGNFEDTLRKITLTYAFSGSASDVDIAVVKIP